MSEVRYEAYDLPRVRPGGPALTAEQLLQVLRPEACGLSLDERRCFLDAGFVVVVEGEGIPQRVLEEYGLAKVIEKKGPALRLVGGAG